MGKKPAPKGKQQSLLNSSFVAIPRLRHYAGGVGFELELPGKVWYNKGADRNKWLKGRIGECEEGHHFGGVTDHGFAFDSDGHRTWLMATAYNNLKWEFLNDPKSKGIKDAELRRQAEISGELASSPFCFR